MRRVVMVVVAVLLFVPVIMKSRKNLETPGLAAFPMFGNNRVTVKVDGDVRHAGIYELPVNSMAVSAIKMALPVRPLKEESSEALCRPLANGSVVLLRLNPDDSYQATIGKMTVSERMLLKIPLDISEMGETDFELLPGVGPGLARNIMAHRQNNGGSLRVEDLLAVDGIGEKKYEKIRALF